MITYNQLIEAIQIISKYNNGQRTLHTVFGDIYLGCGMKKETILDEDILRLQALGWDYNSVVEGFAFIAAQ